MFSITPKQTAEEDETEEEEEENIMVSEVQTVEPLNQTGVLHPAGQSPGGICLFMT